MLGLESSLRPLSVEQFCAVSWTKGDSVENAANSLFFAVDSDSSESHRKSRLNIGVPKYPSIQIFYNVIK